MEVRMVGQGVALNDFAPTHPATRHRVQDPEVRWVTELPEHQRVWTASLN